MSVTSLGRELRLMWDFADQARLRRSVGGLRPLNVDESRSRSAPRTPADNGLTYGISIEA